jgi:antitoxin component YwqK of YwqJK toxin-antitoxin module
MNYLKTIILAFCLTCAFFSCNKYETCQIPKPPVLASINFVDQNGMSETISQPDRLKQYANQNFLESQSHQKILRVFARDYSGSIKAIITSYHTNGHVKQYLEVSDNRAFGTYREWYLDGTLKLETQVIGGVADLNPAAEKSWLFDGLSRAFDECGNLMATIEYCKGELTGTSRYYHKNGKLWKVIPFFKNMAHGTFEIYLENGELLQTSDYANDVKNGKTIRYWPSGQFAADETYIEGRLNTGCYFDLSGNIVAQISLGEGFRAVFGKDFVCELQEFHSGVQEGIVQIFEGDATLVKIYHVKNDTKHGEEIEYYPASIHSNGSQEKISINWFEGNIHGTVKTWYENGTLESQREMTNNMKNGLLTAWYKDGSVMLLESYDHDKLVRAKYFKKQEKTPVSEVVNGNGLATLHDSNGNLLKKITYHNGKPQD